MADDFKRIWARADGKDGPIWLSETDLLKTMQPHMTATSEAAFSLLRKEIPSIAREAVKAYVEEQEEQKRKMAEKLGYIVEPDGTMRPRINPLRSFLSKHWVSLMLFMILLMILWPQIWEVMVRNIPALKFLSGG